MTNALQQLADAGVAVGLDDLSRTQSQSRKLSKLAEHGGVVGVTTNPTIFAKAIGSGAGYEDQVHDLALRGQRLARLCDSLQPGMSGASATPSDPPQPARVGERGGCR